MGKLNVLLFLLVVAVAIIALGCGDDSGSDNNNPVGDQDADIEENTPGDQDVPAEAEEIVEQDEPAEQDESAELEEQAEEKETADENEPDPGDCSGHGVLENGICYCERGWAVDPDDEADCIEYQHEEGTPYLLKIHMHSPAATKIYFSTMSVIGDIDATDYEVYVSHLSGPSFELGSHVQAVNLGNTIDFYSIDEVPETGYASDGEGVENMVIGTGYRSGGEGSTGFIMSENVYALKIGDGNGGFTYAKIEVMQAKAGEVHVLAYRQPNGSRNVATSGGEIDGDMDAEDEAELEEETGDDETAYLFRKELGVAFETSMGAKVSFNTMGAVDAEETWDFELFAIGGGPGIRLGENVTGVNFGNATTFHNIDTVSQPTDFVADNDTDYVIGDSFRNGGSGSAGFVMTENIYLLKRADGSYAKLEVLSARSGVFGFRAYHLPGGGTDLATHADPGESDVWVHVVINCDSGCDSSKVVVVGYTGSSMGGGTPSFMNTWDADVVFPIHTVLTQTGMMSMGPISTGQHTLMAYQDLDSGDGTEPQDGDPASQEIVMDLKTGEWNLLTFDLE